MPELILSLAWTALFVRAIPHMALFRDSAIKSQVFQGLFLVKLLAAIGLYLIYTRYYTDRPHADIFRYFDDSAQISGAFNSHPGHWFRMIFGINAGAPDLAVYYDAMRNWYNTDLVFNDSRTMIRICALLRIFSFGTYFPVAVIMCFLSMAGLTGLFRSFDRVLPGRETILLVGVYLLPSTLLWTSGVIKEAVLMFAAGLFLYQFVLLYREKTFSVRRGVYLLLLACCLFLIKSYFMFLLLPGIASWLLFRNAKHQVRHTLLMHAVYYLLVLFVLPEVITGKSLPLLISGKQQEFYHVAETEQAKSVIRIPAVGKTYSDLMMKVPGAIIRTLTRPVVTEVRNPLMLLSALENLALDLFIVICLFGISRSVQQRWRALHWSALFLVLTLAALVGLITPILGAIVRYKVPLLPFLVFVVATLPADKRFSFRHRILYR